MDHYASRRKDMLAIVNQLHSIGYAPILSWQQATDATSSAQTYIELPRIVVIGNQSAGERFAVQTVLMYSTGRVQRQIECGGGDIWRVCRLYPLLLLTSNYYR